MKTTTISEKDQLKDKIITLLKGIDPESSIMAAGIHAAIQHEFNFEKTIDMISSQYQDNREGMIHCIGAAPIALILRYNRYFKDKA